MSTPTEGIPEVPESAADLYDESPHGSVYLDLTGMITHLNRTVLRWIGYDRATTVGKRHFADLLAPGAKIFFDTHIFPALQLHGEINEIALDLICHDGSVLPALISIVQKRDSSGKPLFNRLTIFNATERRRYEKDLLLARQQAEKANADLHFANLDLEQSRQHLLSMNSRLETEVQARGEALARSERTLEQSRKLEAIGRLAGGIAHDFNNIIAGIAGVSQELQLESHPTSPAYGDLGEILKACDRAFALTKRLLAVGSQQETQPKDIDPNLTIQATINLLARMVGDRIQLRFDPQSKNVIRMDQVQLEQILMNLVLNARDAMPSGGAITVKTTEQQSFHPSTSEAPGEVAAKSDRSFVLEVSDNGVGMKPEILAHIYEPFFTTKEKDKGTGLGLATVYGIVKQNGGSIHVDSKPQEGTRFTIVLPA